MSELDDVLGPYSPLSKPAKQRIKKLLLNLIEQSKEKSLPLHWLTGEIKKL
jgi:hypothetical protein